MDACRAKLSRSFLNSRAQRAAWPQREDAPDHGRREAQLAQLLGDLCLRSVGASCRRERSSAE
jgi:hypothetical protein